MDNIPKRPNVSFSNGPYTRPYPSFQNTPPYQQPPITSKNDNNTSSDSISIPTAVFSIGATLILLGGAYWYLDKKQTAVIETLNGAVSGAVAIATSAEISAARSATAFKDLSESLPVGIKSENVQSAEVCEHGGIRFTNTPDVKI